MEKQQALDQIRAIFASSNVIGLADETIVDNGDGPIEEGFLYTKPGPGGSEVLWCGKVREEGFTLENIPVLRFDQLREITFEPQDEGEREVEVYFELGTGAMPSYRVHFTCCSGEYPRRSTSISVFNRQTRKWSHAAEAASVLVELIEERHTLNQVVAVDDLVGRCLSSVHASPSPEAVARLERVLRAWMEEGSPRWAATYLMLALLGHGTEGIFDRELGLSRVMELDAVVVYRDLLANHFICSFEQETYQRAVEEIEMLALATALEDEVPVALAPDDVAPRDASVDGNEVIPF